VHETRLEMSSLATKATQRSLPGFEKEKESVWRGSFYFIQGSDTQFGMTETYVEKRPNPGWDKEIALAEECIKAINAMEPRPKFFIICGDLVDALPGTKYRSGQEKSFIQVFEALHPDIPLVCVCGNHDVGNTPTPDSIQCYRDKFGDDYFTFYCSGVMFIVLNSQYFEDPSLVEDLMKEQEIWLEKQLEEAKSGKYKHAVVFQHIPWFLKEPDEEKQYFNIVPDLRKKMLCKFYDANIKAIFCGHYHRNAGGFYKDLELVVTSAVGCQLGSDKSGFRVVKVENKSIKHKYYAFADAPKNVCLE